MLRVLLKKVKKKSKVFLLHNIERKEREENTQQITKKTLFKSFSSFPSNTRHYRKSIFISSFSLSLIQFQSRYYIYIYIDMFNWIAKWDDWLDHLFHIYISILNRTIIIITITIIIHEKTVGECRFEMNWELDLESPKWEGMKGMAGIH